MRPNIEISHTLNGRVKDFAAEQGLSTEEGYRELIEYSLENYPRKERDEEEDGIREYRITPEIEEAVKELEFGGSPELQERRREEAKRVLGWLRDSGRWEKSADVKYELHNEEVKNLVEYNERSYWTELARAAFKAADEKGYVERDTRKYRWRQSE